MRTKIIRESQALPSLLETLRRGECAILRCDTIYGIIGSAPETRDKLRLLKGRDEKPFLRLLPSLDSLSAFSPQTIPEALRSYWPGPLSLVLKNHEGGSTAFRIPDHPLLQHLLQSLNHPLFSTSVNQSGEPALNDIKTIIRRFRGQVPLIVDGGSLPENPEPSTILDLTVSPPRILRRGNLRLPPSLLRE